MSTPLSDGSSAERELDALVAERKRLKTGYAVAARSVWGLLFVALLGWVVIAAPRWTLGVDPLLGIPGYLLCPSVCPDCQGPWRLVTVHTWRRTNSASTSGPQYFCPSPSNGIGSLSHDELKARREALSSYELHVAPAVVTWLLVLVLFLPAVPFHAWNAVGVARGRAAELDADLFEAAKAAGVDPPPTPPSPKVGVLFAAIGLVMATVAIALAIVLAEVALHA